MRVGIAQQRAARRAERQPQGQADDERHWRLGEQGHDHHRHGRPRCGAQYLGETALEGHAGQRQADDDHGHQRPLRLLQVEDERQVEAQQACNDGTQREEQHPTARVQGHLEIGNQWSHPAPRDTTREPRMCAWHSGPG
ncbi:hypothetical protein D3C71_1543050 [compost metagenome]